jgi:hypothetical protein
MPSKAWTSTRVRDSQRSKVYTAEDVLGPKTQTIALSDCRALVRRVWASKRARESWPKAFAGWSKPHVRHKHHGNAAGGAQGISLPRWSWTPHIVLHELAHTITRRHYGVYVAGHGWEFCSVYLRLVHLFMGRAAHDALKASFKQHKVKFRAPRTRAPLSPAAKAALVARLQAGKPQPEIVW